MTGVFIRRGRETGTYVYGKKAMWDIWEVTMCKQRRDVSGEIKPVSLDHRLPASRTV